VKNLKKKEKSHEGIFTILISLGPLSMIIYKQNNVNICRVISQALVNIIEYARLVISEN